MGSEMCIRDSPLAAGDKDKATELAQKLIDNRRKNSDVGDEIDQFRMLMALRRAELFLGSPITIPVTLGDVSNIITLAHKQLIENLKTRDIRDEAEYALTDTLFKILNDAATALERQPQSEARDAQLKPLRENHALLLRKRREWRSKKGG